MTAGNDTRQAKAQISGNQIHLMLVYVPVLLKGLDNQALKLREVE